MSKAVLLVVEVLGSCGMLCLQIGAGDVFLVLNRCVELYKYYLRRLEPRAPFHGKETGYVGGFCDVGRHVMIVQTSEVSSLGVGTELRLGADVWSAAK